MTAMILTTLRYTDDLAAHGDQLTLELSTLDEQKSARIIELLEELRRQPHFGYAANSHYARENTLCRTAGFIGLRTAFAPPDDR